MQVRNEWMADRCDVMLALWDGTGGGTGNCMEYLGKKHPEKKVRNAWKRWVKHSSVY